MDLQTDKSFLQVGALIAGRYEVVAKLGTGGMGTVLQVIDKALENEVIALKLLYPHLAQDKTSFARFRNEVLIARRLSHPNIVRLYDIGNAGGGYFFISMEFVNGGNLSKSIYDSRKDLLSFQETLRILREIALGIGHAHSMGVVHRDLKPDNILLTDRGTVKVTDFGLARNLFVDKRFTDTGEAVGTPYYMAPEQLRGERVDGRCDLYALGLIAYEMVVGRRPFFEDTYLQLAAMHLKEPIPDFATKETGIPKWYERFVKKCAAKSPSDRYGSAIEVADFLQEKLDEISGKPTKLRRRPAILSFYASTAKEKGKSFGKKLLAFSIAFLASAALAWAVARNPALKGGVYSLLKPVFSGVAAKVEPAQLFAALKAGDRNQIQTLIASGVDANALDSSGRSLLIAALESQQTQAAFELLQAGADPNIAHPVSKATPLMLAVELPAAEQVVQELLRRGANPDARDAELKTPLMYAARAGNLPMFQILVDAHALLAVRDKEGQTVLMYAVLSERKEVVENLLRKPLDVDAVNDSGRSALFYAVQYKESDLTELLLRAGANPLLKEKSGKTALDVATTKNRKLLKALGKD